MPSLGQTSRVKQVLKKELLVAVINSLVFSKLYYRSVVWSSTTDWNVRKLQGIQNFAARISVKPENMTILLLLQRSYDGYQ